MRPLFKWPGGKGRELVHIRPRIPAHRRYIEPFVGGGAVYFDLEPQEALINDINPTLIAAYDLIGSRPHELEEHLREYAAARKQVAIFGEKVAEEILALHRNLTDHSVGDRKPELEQLIKSMRPSLTEASQAQWPADDALWPYVMAAIMSKVGRIHTHEKKGIEWKDEDVVGQIITGAHAGLYTFVRDGCEPTEDIRKVAQFLYLREFCYGGMFRFNKQGKFNIPYGGRSYNDKSMTGKLNYWFSDEVVGLLARTEKRAESFEEFLPRANLRDDDFIFFDPPYDTEFSDYDQFSFARREQEGLADIFAHLPCPALMIIGKTPLIEQLYLQAQQANPEIVIEEYEKVYAYNVRGRNERGMTHLAIRNYPLPAA